jgi:hypothetical protein
MLSMQQKQLSLRYLIASRILAQVQSSGAHRVSLPCHVSKSRVSYYAISISLTEKVCSISFLPACAYSPRCW